MKAAALRPAGVEAGVTVKRKFVLALIAYAVLGGLAWKTITDEKLRLATFLVLGLFAVKTILRRRDFMDGDEPR